MLIRIRQSGAVVTEQEFRRTHPNTSFPPVLTVDMLDDLGADPVLNGAQPTADRYQVVMQSGVEQIDGQWFTKFVLGPVFNDRTDDEGNVITAETQEAEYRARIDDNQAKSVRADRNKRLVEKDWTQLDDSPQGNKLAWAIYRQALRDLPQQQGFPWDVQWPTRPDQQE